MTRVLVTGASRLFGGEVARQLVAASVLIRILVRDPANAPDLGEIAVGDYTDLDAPSHALYRCNIFKSLI